ncbi:ribonuclease J [Bartonella ancashensis]|uniref:Metallo-beta-lactamase family protein, RNA-specific n=1 Tax=Bartonella ancashensis TaxID=1318743 RepID=A0A0M4LJ51_9HYPH|nr:ribonuclease J [Bartonella ancashensis]ALE03806.1 Metallo-beta-lactamase family protein, RNA-specific [Bartonella ancashensis]
MVAVDGDQLVFFPLGGVGEIGMNLAAYGLGPKDCREWLLVDMGVSFAGPELPGVDLIFPDIHFLENERHNICGLILTHAHEDHYGAVLDLWPRLRVPVYCTPFTAGLLESKKRSDFKFSEILINIFEDGDSFQVGSFVIEAIAVSHSIPEAVSLVITTSLGTVLHTGDWKIDQTPFFEKKTNEKRFRALGNEGILALLCDSTNAFQNDVSPPEKKVQESLATIISEAKGQVAIVTFSSNIGRIRSIALAAESVGRQVFLVGRSLKRSYMVAQELGYMDGLAPFITEDDYVSIPRENVVLIVTGSQGEERAALAKLSRNAMKNISLFPGDTVIYSSRNIPGNERAIIDIQNRLVDLGVKIITNDNALVHVSGHPRRSELLQMYDWVKPQILVPVHGEAMHLEAQADLARQAGIKTVAKIRNGDVLRLAPGPVEIVKKISVGRIYKDGYLLGNENDLGISERRKLSYVGCISISLHISSKHDLSDDIGLFTFGLPAKDGNGELLKDILLDVIEDTIQTISRNKRKDDNLLQKAVCLAVRAIVNEIWGKKPVCTVFVHRSK